MYQTFICFINILTYNFLNLKTNIPPSLFYKTIYILRLFKRSNYIKLILLFNFEKYTTRKSVFKVGYIEHFMTMLLNQTS